MFAESLRQRASHGWKEKSAKMYLFFTFFNATWVFSPKNLHLRRKIRGPPKIGELRKFFLPSREHIFDLLRLLFFVKIPAILTKIFTKKNFFLACDSNIWQEAIFYTNWASQGIQLLQCTKEKRKNRKRIIEEPF